MNCTRKFVGDFGEEVVADSSEVSEKSSEVSEKMN